MTKPIKMNNGKLDDEINDREMNAAEKIDEAEIAAAKAASKKAEAEAKAAQRQAILDRLGLTADEAQLLLG
jgi:hypothetical protein